MLPFGPRMGPFPFRRIKRRGNPLDDEFENSFAALMAQDCRRFSRSAAGAAGLRPECSCGHNPSEVTTTVRGGTAVTIEEQTDYPFRESVTLAMKMTGTARFPLAVRIPAWVAAASVTVNGAPAVGVKAGEFLEIERQWKNGDRVELRFPMAVRTSTWFNNSISVERGPLVYSLQIGESWHKIKQTSPAADWEVYPTTPWNYALVKGAFQVTEKAMARQPYTADASPVEIAAKARRLPQWTLVDDSPGVLPVSPVTTKRAEETVTLVPYGAAKLRITAFPWLE